MVNAFVVIGCQLIKSGSEDLFSFVWKASNWAFKLYFPCKQVLEQMPFWYMNKYLKNLPIVGGGTPLIHPSPLGHFALSLCLYPWLKQIFAIKPLVMMLFQTYTVSHTAQNKLALGVPRTVCTELKIWTCPELMWYVWQSSALCGWVWVGWNKCTQKQQIMTCFFFCHIVRYIGKVTYDQSINRL